MRLNGRIRSTLGAPTGPAMTRLTYCRARGEISLRDADDQVASVVEALAIDLRESRREVRQRRPQRAEQIPIDRRIDRNRDDRLRATQPVTDPLRGFACDLADRGEPDVRALRRTGRYRRCRRRSRQSHPSPIIKSPPSILYCGSIDLIAAPRAFSVTGVSAK